MSTLALLSALVMSVAALIFSIVSLALLYARKDEHPAVAQLRAEQLDLLDKVEHWMKRDAVRRARAGKEAADAAVVTESVPARGTPEYKAFLRRRAMGSS